MKILTVVGARPQFIKAASFSFNLKISKDSGSVFIQASTLIKICQRYFSVSLKSQTPTIY